MPTQIITKVPNFVRNAYDVYETEGTGKLCNNLYLVTTVEDYRKEHILTIIAAQNISAAVEKLLTYSEYKNIQERVKRVGYVYIIDGTGASYTIRYKGEEPWR